MMSEKMPSRLGKSPLLEALFEVRFVPKIPATGDILPGLLYSALKEAYPDVQQLPLASVPRAMRSSEALLKYKASHKLQGQGAAVHIGDKVVLLSATTYPGWCKFKLAIETLIRELAKTELVTTPERCSLRYINLFTGASPASRLNSLHVTLKIKGHHPLERGMHLRMEEDKDGFANVIQIGPDATAKVNNGTPMKGLLVDIDVIGNELPTNFLFSPSEFLERGHTVAKEIFFSLFTQTAIQSMEPEWKE